MLLVLFLRHLFCSHSVRGLFLVTGHKISVCAFTVNTYNIGLLYGKIPSTYNTLTSLSSLAGWLLLFMWFYWPHIFSPSVVYVKYYTISLFVLFFLLHLLLVLTILGWSCPNGFTLTWMGRLTPSKNGNQAIHECTSTWTPQWTTHCPAYLYQPRINLFSSLGLTLERSLIALFSLAPRSHVSQAAPLAMVWWCW
jgi:hypothetical protein